MQPDTGFQQTTKITAERRGFITRAIHSLSLFYIADPRQPLIIFNPHTFTGDIRVIILLKSK
jgi:hypothetical protein